ncbi:MAG: SPOR domain-containing protein [Alteromonadales bacterium]|nr:SPOR domain-containing protein [Alteromonadales bacterium]
MKINSKVMLTLPLLLIISGCSSTSGPSAEMEKITNQQVEIDTLKQQHIVLEQQLQTWEEARPEVNRLVALESKLNALIIEQKEIAKANKLKARKEKRKQREARPFFMLQLSSLYSLDKLKTSWLSEQKLYPELLNGLPARYQQVEISGKQYFRLKAGEFNQKADALKACQALIAEGGDCVVVNNKGTKL